MSFVGYPRYQNAEILVSNQSLGAGGLANLGVTLEEGASYELSFGQGAAPSTPTLISIPAGATNPIPWNIAGNAVFRFIATSGQVSIGLGGVIPAANITLRRVY